MHSLTNRGRWDAWNGKVIFPPISKMNQALVQPEKHKAPAKWSRADIYSPPNFPRQFHYLFSTKK